MSDTRVFASQLNTGRSPDGNWLALRGLRDGALVSAPWFQALVFEGRCFGAAFVDAFTIGPDHRVQFLYAPLLGGEFLG